MDFITFGALKELVEYFEVKNVRGKQFYETVILTLFNRKPNCKNDYEDFRCKCASYFNIYNTKIKKRRNKYHKDYMEQQLLFNPQ